jgi:hypothetical protein
VIDLSRVRREADDNPDDPDAQERLLAILARENPMQVSAIVPQRWDGTEAPFASTVRVGGWVDKAGSLVLETLSHMVAVSVNDF